ncbi:MAG: hypothetical protein Q8O55_07625 [Dehalococcoidales bacterium]|nr:hypothetical protein [Dehalococcoidales bacterium]
MTSEQGSKSKLEDVLKGEKGAGSKAGQTGSVELKSALERELGAVDEELAKELQRTRAEELIERRRMAIERMRGGQAAADAGGGKPEGRGKEWLTDMAQGLLERGMEPAVVGRTIDYLLGNNSFPSVGMPGNGAPQGGMSFTDMKELFKMGQESNKSDPNLAILLERLTNKIEAVEKIASAPRNEQARPRTAFIVKSDNTLEEVPLDRPILLEAKPIAGGKSIEMLKEENRHAEEVERLKTESKYKVSVAETLASIPEKIGRGLASQAMGEEEEVVAGARSAAKTIETEVFKCTDEQCGKEFNITKGALKVQCPYCATIYTRTEDK